MTRAILPLSVLLVLAAAPSWAERVQVFSVQGADCASCADRIKDELKKTKGVGRIEFDKQKVELTVKLEDGIGDETVVSAVERAGFKATVGPGQGAYLPHPDYPAGADVLWLTKDGSAVGPLSKRRAAAKYTVFDVYADWCGPCRTVDERLRDIVGQRADVAVRKLNLVDFESPLGKELGSRLEALPYLVVFTPSGKRIDIAGVDMAKLDKALASK
jgi:copper chaperone CopZ/thiol-disulfide isomerase/thioredoxin